MAYLLSNLLQDAYRRLGQTYTFTATGGSTTTFIDTNLKEKYQDDQLVDWTVFVTRDTGGVAPENEYSRISAYLESTNTATIGTLTAGIASGDTLTIASNRFPLREMIEAANRALSGIGDIVLIDTSLTTAASQTEYAIPVALKREPPIKVQLQGTTSDSNANEWIDLQPDEYDIVPAAPGSTGLLVFRAQPETGLNLKIWYKGVHPNLTVYSSVVSETIHPEIAATGLVAHMLEWFVSSTEGDSDFWLMRLNDARREFDIAKQKHGMWKPNRRNKLLTVKYD